MLEPRLPYLPRKADQRLRGPVLSCRALSAALLAQVRVSSCDHRVFGDCCADDARKTVKEWCNDAWSRTTVVAPRRDIALRSVRLAVNGGEKNLHCASAARPSLVRCRLRSISPRIRSER